MTDRLAELAAMIDANPQDQRVYEVYADELQRLGDPRGDLMALQLRDADDPRALPLLALAGIAVGPPIAMARWRWGFVQLAEIDPDAGTDADHQAALDHPSLRFLETLWIGRTETRMQAVVDALASRARPTIEDLRFGAIVNLGKPVPDRYSLDLGNLDALWPALPRLEALGITGQPSSVGKLALPSLRSLSIESISIRPAVIAAIAAAEWPWLEVLELSFGHAVVDVAAVVDMLSRIPKLECLDLSGNFLDDLIEPLTRLPVLGNLERLSLHRGLTDRGGEAILRHADAFAHLAQLDVSRNYLSGPVVAQIHEIAKAVADKQDEPPDRDPDLYDY